MSTLQEQILECARDLYLENGFPGLSMRKIAEQLDVSATAIYRHYENKESLVYKVIAEGYTLFGAYLYTALEGKTPAERLDLGSKAYLRFALEQSKYYEVLFMAPHHVGRGDVPEEVTRKGEATFQFLIDRVQECIQAGILKEIDSHEMALILWAHSHGLVSLYLSQKLPFDAKAFQAFFLHSKNQLLLGLCSPKGKKLWEKP